MKINYLFPNRFNKLGWVIFLFGLTLGVYFLFWNDQGLNWLSIEVLALVDDNFAHPNFFKAIENNVFDEIILSLLIIGGLFITFSREKKEDEFIAKIRLESLVWATYVNYTLLLITILFVFGNGFLWVMIFNTFTILVFFLIRFNWVLYQSKKSLKYEE